MTRSGTIISVRKDAGQLRDVLVQGPACDPWGDYHPASAGKIGKAVEQHRRLVRELEIAGATVRHVDALLHSALAYADARDWILERRLHRRGNEWSVAGGILEWLSDQPPDRLTRYLMGGMRLTDLPAALRPRVPATTNRSGWLMPPLGSEVMLPRRLLRVIDGGVLLARAGEHESHAAATVSAVLNFAPLFDQSRFEFLLACDSADLSPPPIAGNDIAVAGEDVLVGAITRGTSIQALSLLAASLFSQNRSRCMFWLDLTGTGCDCLDDCFVPLRRDCLLVDLRLLETANAFRVCTGHGGVVLRIETCRSSFIRELGRSMGTAELCLVDMLRHPEPAAAALRRLAPIVLAPGRLLVFEAHEAAFRVLERQGIEIASCLPGTAISPQGKGPRGLLTALHTI